MSVPVVVRKSFPEGPCLSQLMQSSSSLTMLPVQLGQRVLCMPDKSSSVSFQGRILHPCKLVRLLEINGTIFAAECTHDGTLKTES